MSVRARAVIPDGAGRVLFDRTHHLDRAPFYWLPGGGVEPGETAEEALGRELIEEASLVIHVRRLLYISENLSKVPTRTVYYGRFKDNPTVFQISPVFVESLKQTPVLKKEEKEDKK